MLFDAINPWYQGRMGEGTFPWLAPLYEVLDTDFEDPPERMAESEIAGKVAKMGGVESLSWVLVHEMGPEGLEVFQPLVDRPGGERLYHGAVVLTQYPPYLTHPSFKETGETPPGAYPEARLLTRMRDYAAKGERDRSWFFTDGMLLSMNDAGKVSKEIDDPETFVHALRSALL